MKKLSIHYVFAIGLIFIAAISRLFPILPNFQPVTALALFAGAIFFADRKFGILIPVSAMIFSDILLHFFSQSLIGYYVGFHESMIAVYLSLALISLYGMKFTRKNKLSSVFLGSISGALIFFIITNFSSWLLSPDINNLPYSKDFVGFIRCYTEALPFFRNTLLSSIIYSFVIFGAYKLAEKYTFSLVPIKTK
jgi:hypothetical protein